MKKGAIDIGIKTKEVLDKKIKDIQTSSAKVVKATVSDMRTRVPSWVADEVAQVYAIKKKEITPAKVGKGKSQGKKLGTIKVKGDTIDTMAIYYKGRRLTPTHFHMTPKKPTGKRQKATQAVPGGGIAFQKGKSEVATIAPPKPYKVTQTVYKGAKKQIKGNPKYSNPVFLAPVRAGRSTYIPFQRTGDGAKDMISIKTTSVPQMIDNPDVKEKIQQRISKDLAKRLDHHIDRYIK